MSVCYFSSKYMINVLTTVCRCRLNAKMYLSQGKKNAVSVFFALDCYVSVTEHPYVAIT